MYCQICSALNDDNEEYCRRCHQKLLVVSGPYTEEDQQAFENKPEEQYSFDEHLLERISILEEVVRRTAEMVRQSLSTSYKLEQQILVNQTGITTLRDLLENKRVFGRAEWSELWESRMDSQLLALEKRERFAAVKEQIGALFQGDERQAFHDRLDAAEAAFEAFDVQTATSELEAAHELDPANHELAFLLAETFFNDGASDIALEYFARVLAVKPEHFESLVYSGVLCHEAERAERAEELLKRAVAHYPEAFLPTFSLGAVYAAQGRLPQAVVFLERAVDCEALPQAHYLLGGCCYEMGKVTAAIRHLRHAVHLDPGFQEAHDLLGLAYLGRRWYRKALTALRESQRLRPNTLDYPELLQFLSADGEGLDVSEAAAGWIQQAEAAMRRGDARDALTWYRHALAEDSENPTLLVAYAMACLDLGREPEIVPLIERALNLEPAERLEVSAYATLIEALRLEGRYREGNRIGRSMLRDDSSSFARTVAYFEMAFNLADMGEDLDEALDFARRSVELAPPELERFPLAALGWVHYRRQEFQQSIECLKRSNALGSSTRTLTHLGMALLAAGERQEAHRVLEQARTASEGWPLKLSVLEALRVGTRLLQGAPAPAKK
ncbi:MAG: tetratricopeptide repeat protein [Acidobacteriota bacterium]